MTRRVGILGGTFDPIHCGHLDLALAVQRALQLTSLLVIPGKHSPASPAAERLGVPSVRDDCDCCCGSHRLAGFGLELSQPSPSYTEATLTRLHQDGYRASELFFVIGADAFGDIRSWKDYPRILDGAHFAVVSRPGSPVSSLSQRLPEMAARMKPASSDVNTDAVSIFLIDAKTADVSSTAIRQRRQQGQTISGLVPPGVEQHIEQHGLYRSIAPNELHDERLENPAAGRLHGQS